MSDTHKKLQHGNNYSHWKILYLVLDLNYFSFSNPNHNPTHLPKHQTLSPNLQFFQRSWYVEYPSAHAHMAWSQKFRLIPGCASNSRVVHFLCSISRIRKDLSAASFCSCKLLWRSDECVLLPCFNAEPDIFAVMNCCVVALSVFSSDILTCSADSLYSIQWQIN